MPAVLVECGGTHRAAVAPASSTTTTTTAPHRKAAKPKARPKADPPVPKALFAKDLSLRAGPVPVPLQLLIPSINVTSQVLGVGVTPGDVMDAPEGPVERPGLAGGVLVPRQRDTRRRQHCADRRPHQRSARDDAASSAPSTACKQGDIIIVRDTRSRLDVRFAVTSSMSFTLDQTTQPDVLKRIYGVGPVAGTTPQRATDGRAHLTLVTCAGSFNTGLGTHDHRLAVFATRVV